MASPSSLFAGPLIPGVVRITLLGHDDGWRFVEWARADFRALAPPAEEHCAKRFATKDAALAFFRELFETQPPKY